MVNIPVNYKRMAAAFDEMARVRSCESSGSEHSADLSDLVNSFFEREIRQGRKSEEVVGDKDGNDINDESENSSPDFEFEDSLKKLFNRERDGVKRSIHAQVEKALEEVSGDKSKPDFIRRLMARLRSGGFDAGLCKSKWEKNGRNPSGNYEYIDVNAGESRYIVEVFLAGEFTIARPTGCYASLLDVIPPIFVGEPEELNQVAKLMCMAMRKSMKSVELNVPPWRRLAYMRAKWFGSYKRTINEVRTGNATKDMAGNRLVGFETGDGSFFKLKTGFCSAKTGFRIGNLAVAFNQKEICDQ